MLRALFLSPHLDDVVFSCGGTLGRLAAEVGWEVTLVTVFTASVPAPSGFALRCQTDKGIAPEVDYMALRRDEDEEAAGRLGVPEERLAHWPLPEAPHRGYDSPAELFAGIRPDDVIWTDVARRLQSLAAELAPDVMFAPQGLGNHVDHLQVIRAVRTVEGLADRTAWYRDTPYAIRQPDARPAPDLPAGLREGAVDISGETLARKASASAAYATQIGFQFGGGVAEVRRELDAFHRGEADRAPVRLPVGAVHAERFLLPPAGLPWPGSLLTSESVFPA